MKKVAKWSILMLAVVMISVCSSCGGSDDGQDTQKVDGVNVITGKKLVYLNIEVVKLENNYNGLSSGNYNLKMEYDSKGRLSKVLQIKHFGDGIQNDKISEVAVIDYDLCEISLFYSGRYRFMLNNKGYVSQIGNSTCVYDDAGYLVGTENSRQIVSLTYENEDVARSVVNNIAYNKMRMCHFYYGDNSNTGELYFQMETEDNHIDSHKYAEAVVSLIAYLSGLFGKTSKHCTYLTKTDETIAYFNKYVENGYNRNISLKCTFVYE